MRKTLFLTCEAGPRTSAKKKSIWTRELFGAEKLPPEAIALQGQKWTLVLGIQTVQLLNEAGEVVVAFRRESAESAIRLPFYQWDPDQIANLGIATANSSDYHWFGPDKSVIREIKRYLDQTILFQGPEAIQNYRRSAWQRFAWGCVGLIGIPAIGFLLAGILGLLTSIVAQTWGGSSFIFVGIMAGSIVGGITCFAGGIRALFRLIRLRRLLQELGTDDC